jgi:SNF2 family DNA or RNA helicase
LWKTLSEEQVTAAQFALDREGSGLFLEQGVGKTRVALAVIERLEAKAVLIVGRLANKETTWIENLEQWLPDYSITHSWEDFKADKSDLRILLVHTQALRRRRVGRRKVGQIDKIVKFKGWDLCIWDESQDLKSRGSETSRVGSRLGNLPRRVALTGTPLDQQPGELWAQMRFIESGAFGTNWKQFDLEYLEQPSVDPSLHRPGTEAWRKAMFVARIQRSKAGIREDAAKRFNRILSRYCLRIDKDVLKLPPSREVKVDVPLSPKARRVYDELEQTLVTKVNGVAIKGALAITKNAKLAQIPGGWIIDEDGDRHRLGRSKLFALEDLVMKTLRRPFLVFALYRHEIEAIGALLQDLGVEHSTYHGGVKKRDRVEIVREFARGEVDALVLQLKAGGVGLDGLQVAPDAVFYSFSHSYIDYRQARARVERRGQTQPMRFFPLVAPDTIDQDKWEAIQHKGKVEEFFMKRLRKKFADRS